MHKKLKVVALIALVFAAVSSVVVILSLNSKDKDKEDEPENSKEYKKLIRKYCNIISKPYRNYEDEQEEFDSINKTEEEEYTEENNISQKDEAEEIDESDFDDNYDINDYNYDIDNK